MEFREPQAGQRGMWRRPFIRWAGAGLGATFVPQPAWIEAQTTRNLSIATGGTGDVYYVIGGALANLLTKNIPQVKVTAESMATSVENARLIATQKANIALMLGFEAQDAYLGKTQVPLRALSVIYSNLCQFAAREGIESIRASG
jgi:TRAP transporter TAXI family solute receptor